MKGTRTFHVVQKTDLRFTTLIPLKLQKDLFEVLSILVNIPRLWKRNCSSRNDGSDKYFGISGWREEPKVSPSTGYPLG